MPANLLLHCGAHAVNRSDVINTPAPMPTRTWQPIPHEDYIRQVEHILPRYGLKVVNEAHAITHDGARYFGLMELQNGSNHEEFSWVLGLRNSHDQTLPAGMVAGSQVLVCDNLCFSGEVKLARKHTRFIMRDLPVLIIEALDTLRGKWNDEGRRIEAYRDTRMVDRQVHDLTIKALDAGVIPASRIPKVLNEWREPSHLEFAPRNAWSLFNAFTEVLKGNLHQLPARTQSLYGLMDRAVGFG